MSKWIKEDIFDEFVKEKENEAEPPSYGSSRMDIIWPTPEKGTRDRAKTYVGRFLPDQKGKFYKKYFYHMFQVGGKWQNFLCPKTHGMDEFCIICTLSQRLYNGSAQDKKLARKYKRNQKFAGNFFIVDDPRDSERDEEKKMNGTVRVYEFPATIESKLKSMVTDRKHGLGSSIFDPGDDGFNFILKVKSKPPAGEEKKVWPDYSESMFAVRPDALGSDAEIKGIMESTHDMEDYVNSLARPEEEMINVLKMEELWELVKGEYDLAKGLGSSNIDSILNQQEQDIDEAFSRESEETTKEITSDDDDDMDDAELLAELDALGED